MWPSSQSRMSCQSPLSWSLTKTEAVMCMALTSTIPSWMPDLARAASTLSVMSMISWRFWVLKVRYSVWLFTGIPPHRPSLRPEATAEKPGAGLPGPTQAAAGPGLYHTRKEPGREGRRAAEWTQLSDDTRWEEAGPCGLAWWERERWAATSGPC